MPDDRHQQSQSKAQAFRCRSGFSSAANHPLRSQQFPGELAQAEIHSHVSEMNNGIFENPPPGHFCLATNMIFSGRFWFAGQPMPLAMLKEIPEVLRKPKNILKHDPHYQPETESTPLLSYTLGTQYAVDEQSPSQTSSAT